MFTWTTLSNSLLSLSLQTLLSTWHFRVFGFLLIDYTYIRRLDYWLGFVFQLRFKFFCRLHKCNQIKFCQKWFLELVSNNDITRGKMSYDLMGKALFIWLSVLSRSSCIRGRLCIIQAKDFDFDDKKHYNQVTFKYAFI